MLGILKRWKERRQAGSARRADEEAHMSPEERRFIHESVEDHQADELVQEHLGGESPSHLVDDGGEALPD